MKSFKEFVTEAASLPKKGKKLKMSVWHGTRETKFKKFDEKFLATENDEGFAGRGFYVFGAERYVASAVPDGYKKEFALNLSNAVELKNDASDPFSNYDGPADKFAEFRDQVTLDWLEAGFDGSYRKIQGNIEEICIFSYKSKGYDGNKKIKEIKGEDWEPLKDVEEEVSTGSIAITPMPLGKKKKKEDE